MYDKEFQDNISHLFLQDAVLFVYELKKRDIGLSLGFKILKIARVW